MIDHLVLHIWSVCNSVKVPNQKTFTGHFLQQTLVLLAGKEATLATSLGRKTKALWLHNLYYFSYTAELLQ
jgi:hypothetical protein